MPEVYTSGLSILTDSITFDEMWITFNENGWVRDIFALNESLFVAQVEHTSIVRSPPVDSTHESYEIARDAVVAGTAAIKYLFNTNPAIDPEEVVDSYVFEKDDVPTGYKHLLQYDTFSADVASQEQQIEDVRWSELTFFKYDNSSDLAVPVPGFDDGDVDGLIEDMETGGWYRTTSDANTNKGTNTILRTAIVSYEYVGNTDTSTVSVSIIPRDNIRYSTGRRDFYGRSAGRRGRHHTSGNHGWRRND